MKFIVSLILTFYSLLSLGQTSDLYPSATGEDYNTWDNPTNGYSNKGVRTTLYYTSMPGSQDYYNYNVPDLTGNTPVGIEIKGEVYNNNDYGTYSELQVEISWNGGVTYTTSGKYFRTSNSWTEEPFTLGGP